MKDGDRWRIHALHHDGGLDAVHTQSGRHVRLPVDYVQGFVELGRGGDDGQHLGVGELVQPDLADAGNDEAPHTSVS